MKKLFFVLMSLLMIAACRKGWGDDHVPTSYSDGVFSFDYKGERYHQYRGGNIFHPLGCSAFAIYHDLADFAQDTLIIRGGAACNKKDYTISFMIPVKKVLDFGPKVYLNENEVHAEMGAWVSENRYQYYHVTAESVSVVFDHFFDGDEYVEGSFSLTVADATDIRKYKMSNGLFKLRPRPINKAFCRNQNRWYALPSYSDQF